MIAAAVDEDELRAVRRPAEGIALALCLYERGWLIGTAKFQSPNIAFGNVGDQIAFWGWSGGVTLRQLAWRLLVERAIDRHQP